ncbi:copper homeostasis protein cutC homolog [Harmonia axyridis]|uniref:copper homeostasis protein cutC homolog n=1 Tax=Harmonia axyridis TaxID=115357 RepID=UPI001E279027|nr:copper homeostasis protein cutC homolog [Harmonia axyridis]
MSKVLEVCVDSLDSATAAVAGGAGRIELCASLLEGGLTPTPGLLIQVQNLSGNKVPIYCMLRCRPGNFIYNRQELEVMVEDAKILRKYGANGFVFGALDENGAVDMKMCREIVKACYPCPVTFHRAFDFCERPSIEIEVIIDLGFERVLTSGKQSNAQLGVKLIKKLMEQVGSRIIIMPGGGLNKENFKFIMENTEAKEYHGSFRKLKSTIEQDDCNTTDVKIGEHSGPMHVTDKEYVAEIVHMLTNC